MFVEFSKVNHPKSAPEISLSCIYHIDADENYRVHKGVFRGRMGSVAVRTLKGEGLISIYGGKEFSLKADSLLILPAWKLEKYYPALDSWEFWWFEFSAGETELPEERILKAPGSAGETETMRRSLELLQRETGGDLSAASAEFSALLFRWLENDEAGAPGAKDGIDAAIRQIKAKPEQSWDCEALAAECFLSERRFRDLFRERTGVTPKQYIINARMEKACVMLQSTGLSVAAVAESCGYPDGFYFSRLFSSVHGKSPLRYRREWQEID